jgi:hypothetical protein
MGMGAVVVVVMPTAQKINPTEEVVPDLWEKV